MRRYSNIGVNTRYDGKRVYKTAIYPVIPQSTSDLIVVSNEGDFLDTLAYKYMETQLYFGLLPMQTILAKVGLVCQQGCH